MDAWALLDRILSAAPVRECAWSQSAVSLWELLAIGSSGVGVDRAVKQLLCAGARCSHESAGSGRRMSVHDGDFLQEARVACRGGAECCFRWCRRTNASYAGALCLLEYSASS
jgi:hypothetical protein